MQLKNEINIRENAWPVGVRPIDAKDLGPVWDRGHQQRVA